MSDTVFHSRSEGISLEGVKDQYADGKAAKVWTKFIGDIHERTQNYKNFMIGLLKTHKCSQILDVACGTGVDSMMLVDEGFKVTSIDASDKMLKYALKSRWEKRKNPKYDEWVIEEANWVTLYDDMQSVTPNKQYDAVLCIGNSFAHLLDAYGDQREQKTALANFAKCLKPGGLLIIDHRNYDAITESGATPGKSIYYNSKYQVDIKTSVLMVSGKPELVTLDYFLQDANDVNGGERSEFRLSYYPHKLKQFSEMLDQAFGNKARHDLYGDFKPLNEITNPAFYIHVIEKPLN